MVVRKFYRVVHRILAASHKFVSAAGFPLNLLCGPIFYGATFIFCISVQHHRSSLGRMALDETSSVN